MTPIICILLVQYVRHVISISVCFGCDSSCDLDFEEMIAKVFILRENEVIHIVTFEGGTAKRGVE